METSGILQNSSSLKINNHKTYDADIFPLPYRAKQGHQKQDIENQQRGNNALENPIISHSFKLRDMSTDGMKNNGDVENSEQQGILPDFDVDSHEDSDCYLLPILGSKVLTSPHHEPEVGVDSFGLPLTLFEREATQNAN